MKILLYTESENVVGKSGLGKAIQHQMKALEKNNIEYTTNPDDDYDILHINTYFPASYMMAKNAKKSGKGVVYHAHSTAEDYQNGFVLSKQTVNQFKKWLVHCYKLGDVIVTPTDYSKKLLESYGMERKIYAISNGIEIEKFKKNPIAGEMFREQYGFSKEDKVIIGIGLYIERKGIVDFVELARRMPEYQFIWFGYSPLVAATKNVRTAVRTKLNNLTFAGYVEADMIIGAMSGCDLFLSPTLEETEGIPIIEACACKCKTLIRDIPVFEDWLEDGINIYKAKNIDEFEEKIPKIISGELPDLTEVAYQVALARSLEVVGQKLKLVYEEVMKTKSSSNSKELEKANK